MNRKHIVPGITVTETDMGLEYPKEYAELEFACPCGSKTVIAGFGDWNLDLTTCDKCGRKFLIQSPEICRKMDNYLGGTWSEVSFKEFTRLEGQKLKNK